MTKPVVTAFDNTVLLGSFLTPDQLFEVTDADGDPITSYFVFDGSNAADSGRFSVYGSVLAANVWHELSTGDLLGLRFNAGTSIGIDQLKFRASDGQVSNVATSLAYSVTVNDDRPISSIDWFSIVAYEKIAVSSLISAFDPDGYPITRHKFRDRFVDGGYFELDGVAQDQRDWFYVENADIDKLFYVAGLSNQLEVIDYRARDTSLWSLRTWAKAETTPNSNRPVVQYASHLFQTESVNLITGLFEWTDEDNNTLKSYEFYDPNGSGDSGFVSVRGLKKSSGTWITVSAEDIPFTTWTTAKIDTTETFRVRVNDGRFWSGIQTVSISSIPSPEIDAPDGVVMTPQLELISLAPFFSQVDSGPGFTQYQVLDANADPTSSKLRLGGVDQVGGVVRTLSSAQFNGAQIHAGTYEQRSRDEFYVRAFNGTFWSNWESITVRTEPEIIASLQNETWYNYSETVPEITFSFMQAYPDYETGEASALTFSKYTDEQRNGARRGFRSVERFANLNFREVVDSQIDSEGRIGGTIRLGNWFNPFSLFEAYAFQPDDTIDRPEGGDIWFNRALLSVFDWSNDTRSYWTFLHEVGHAIGLKHPFAGAANLPEATSNKMYTAQAYTQREDFVEPRTHLLYDVAAIQAIYGANNAYNTGNDVYDLAAYWENDLDFADLIWDAGGIDEIRISNSTFNNVIDLEEGGSSSIGIRNDNLWVAFGTIIENATGGLGDDVLFGNKVDNVLDGGSGHDVMYGRGGNDTMRGRLGNDEYVIGNDNGSDFITELSGTGRDRLTFEEGTITGLDDFTEDVSFQKLGIDLIMKLTIDGGQSQGEVRIQNQAWGRWRVETLSILGQEVDLRSVYEQATSTDKHFIVTDIDGAFGKLVVPV